MGRLKDGLEFGATSAIQRRMLSPQQQRDALADFAIRTVLFCIACVIAGVLFKIGWNLF